jgi:hypothetical protein
LPPVPVRLPDGTIENRIAEELPRQFDQVIQNWDMALKEPAIRTTWWDRFWRRAEQIDIYWIRPGIAWIYQGQ